MIKQFRVELGQSRTSLEKQKVKNKKEGWRQNRGNGLNYHVYIGGIQMSGEKINYNTKDMSMMTCWERNIYFDLPEDRLWDCLIPKSRIG